MASHHMPQIHTPYRLKETAHPPPFLKQQAIVQILMKKPQFITVEEIILVPLINGGG